MSVRVRKKYYIIISGSIKKSALGCCHILEDKRVTLIGFVDKLNGRYSSEKQFKNLNKHFHLIQVRRKQTKL